MSGFSRERRLCVIYIAAQSAFAVQALPKTKKEGIEMPATIVQARVSQPLASLPPHLARQVWRGGQLGRAACKSVPSGQAALDAELPGGGWPTGGLTELLLAQPGMGEMRLLAPALRALTANGPQARYVALIAPPYLPNAPTLAAWGIALERVIWVKADADARQALWAAEQTLKHDGVGAVLVWLPKVRADALRRLQVLAQDGQALAFLMRPASAAAQSSPAPLRILCRALPGAESVVRADPHGGVADAGANPAAHAEDQHTSCLQLEILKRRGPALAAPLCLRLPLEVPAGWPVVATLPFSIHGAAETEALADLQEHAMDRSESSGHDASHDLAHLQENSDVVDRRDAAGSAARSARTALTVPA